MSKTKLTTACGTVTNFLREVKGEYDKYVETKVTPQSRFALQARLEELEDIFASAKRHHMLIVASTESSEVKTSYLEQEIFGTLKELYFQYMATLKEALDTLNVSKETASPTISSDFKLPAIKIPCFGGNYESWPEFSNLFKSIVHDNNTLSKVQKLHYLKANVSDEAARLLQHLVINEKNYDSAWTILTTRYEHKRLLVNCQLRLFCNQAKLHNEDVKGIKALLDTTNECVQSLRNLEVPVHQWDAIIIHLMIQKLPSQTQGLWEEHLGSSKALPDFADFTEFLTNRYRTLEAIGQIAKTGQGPSAKKISLHTRENDYYSCALCNGSHSMRRCSKFLAADPKKRQEITRQHHLCFNCLARGHDRNSCPSHFKCAECQGQHHTLLHIQANNARGSNTSYQPNRNGQQMQRPRDPQPSTSQNCNAYVMEEIQMTTGGRPEKKQPTVLLATMLVNAMDQSGKLITLRALLDPGSEASYITESAIQLLKLRKTKQITEIGGIGGVNSCCSKASALVSLHSLMNHDFDITIQVLVLPRLTAWLPSKKMDKSEWPHISGLALADPQFNQPNKIDILLGSDVYPEISLQGLIKGKCGTPMAQQTVFGWVLIGPVFEGNRVTNAFCTQTENVEGILQGFWEIEQDPQNLVFTREEEDCESHFCETHERLLDGRYKVSLPFKEGRRPQMGRSYNSALARFLQLEKRFKTNPDFAHKYKQGMEEYFELDQIEEVPNVQLINAHQHYYLPHHAVMKESSTTTKLRIVFDASCPTSDGSSLNDHLLTGPKQQDNIIDHILRFRKHRVAFVADINKMYRQIWIANQDAMYQLILWRRREDQEVKTFRLKTVTFGTAAAPFLAIRTLRQLAADEGNDFPLAATIAENNFYVDDVIHGADSIPEANRMREELMRMMSLGGFPLRKWASNSNEVLEAIPAEFRELELPLSFNEKDCIKTLGIQWHPARDIFTFKLNRIEHKSCTKRTILSDIARIYDPMGWISPCIIKAKMLMQEMWKQQVDWDDEVDAEIKAKWERFSTELRELENLQIPRWIHTIKQSEVQLHGFSDASEKGYAAAIYLRTKTHGIVTTSLIISKTKVAPVKRETLPRLELCGALLLAKLMSHVVKMIQLEQLQIFTWTDSQIVLAWITHAPHKRETFVANRVAEIQRLTNVQNWKYVPSKENPADIASRGVFPSQLMECRQWWDGPSFLENFSAQTHIDQEIRDTDLGTKKTLLKQRTETSYVSHLNKCNANRNIFSVCMYIQGTKDIALMDRFSSLQRLLRVTAYCFRFNNNCKKGIPKLSGKLTIKELEGAMLRIIKIVQREHFEEEVKHLTDQNTLNKKSTLKRLSPFLDENGVLRVGGRLDNADLPYDQRHPILLPATNPLTTLLIRDAHMRTMHGGQQQMMAYLRTRFWIQRMKTGVKKCIHACITCFRNKPTIEQQQMGQLPSARVQLARPFYNSGVDFAGPIQVKAWKGRCNKLLKAYISIFICLCTKAIHIELVSDYSAAAFLAAFKRFVARRGICANMYSDCGTNFVGAKNMMTAELKQLTKQWNTEINDQLIANGTTWHFNPPSAPHFGGLWEAGVKSIKFHLHRIMGNYTLTFEEMCTTLTQIEACLNSRPLCPLSEDCEDLQVLTPGHFLIGSALNTTPEKDFTEFKENSLTRWQLMQKIMQDFWKIWKTEYLARLQQRPKWLNPSTNLKIGELVLIKDDQSPPTLWPLGRITETKPGADGLIRVVTVKTAKGTYVRPIAKVCKLPIEP